MITGILLFPFDGSCSPLLAEDGSLGSRPPAVWSFDGERTRFVPAGPWPLRYGGDPRFKEVGLALAWGGKVIPEGVDRAARVLMTKLLESSNPEFRGSYSYGLLEAEDIARDCEAHGLGRVVLVRSAEEG